MSSWEIEGMWSFSGDFPTREGRYGKKEKGGWVKAGNGRLVGLFNVSTLGRIVVAERLPVYTYIQPV